MDPVIELLHEGAVGVIPTDTVYVDYFFLFFPSVEFCAFSASRVIIIERTWENLWCRNTTCIFKTKCSKIKGHFVQFFDGNYNERLLLWIMRIKMINSPL